MAKQNVSIQQLFNDLQTALNTSESFFEYDNVADSYDVFKTVMQIAEQLDNKLYDQYMSN